MRDMRDRSEREIMDMRKRKSILTDKSVDMTDDRLSLKQRAFVREYLVDRNGTQAAIRAGYSPHTAQEQSSDLLSKPIIKQLVAEKEAAAAAAAHVDATLVISELYQVATADPRSLTEIHRGACRNCYGYAGDRMWTQGEYLDTWHAAKAEDPNAPAPPMRGGIGYNFTQQPNPECGECRGFGTERVFIKDTRKLSRAAAKLIAGVKQTKDGIELKHRDQDGALMALGKVCGIFVDRSELSGPGGGPVEIAATGPLELSDSAKRVLVQLKLETLGVEEGVVDQQLLPSPSESDS
jgi:phage terminase small subunit